jgi:hypothetical protein
MPSHTKPEEMKTQSNQKKLGDRLYIFESSKGSHSCMISAHGGYWIGTGKFTVPQGITIYLYSQHGTVLSDPGIGFLTKDDGIQPVETLTSGQKCYKYMLSKYQGYHGSQKETYKKISEKVDDVDKRVDLYQNDINKMLDKGGQEKNINVLLTSNATRASHIVTIRNRRLKTDVNLEFVVKKVLKSYPSVTEFHCSHCRSNQYLPS